ncbi:type I-E CRISPR-associated protein Cas7/Cse4/CasC [Methanoculleus bourgensis]|uniref:type I-E CRISPR-associated protein Cas7/Cse4/CasC n=1 Tax=Methanoculleus bourgensis TaxID=83986 RepID=UPI0022EE0B86|nr:type I-E CRISPR-associated protein Cas7/Cse4/CasC [Methanoculleus bourgensis]GLI45713.1 type I-E CRISPR-associated protein Cas7/Cse4/CasC [Methanoculleus bourgensis]
MSEFIQLHILTSYPPSNLNRDDLGTPKTAMMGGARRLRVSSQSLKRAWRTSDAFQKAFNGHLGIRTKEMGWQVYLALKEGKKLVDVIKGDDADPVNPPVGERDAVAWAQEIAGVFGKLKVPKEKENEDPEKKKKESLCVEQMVHFSPEEIAAIDDLIARLAASGENPSGEDLDLLRNQCSAVDIAMFGRMLAANPAFNKEAAVQVAHAISVHRVAVEDDYFTAVDDLNRGEEDVGAGHVGQAEFAAGLFYAYLCINRDLLVENLGNDAALADRAIRALVEAAVKVGPKGKQNSFASRAYASYLLAERGREQPRSLSVAFLKPVSGDDYLGNAIQTLTRTRKNMEEAYGACADACQEMNAVTGEGTLDEILRFVADGHA